MRKLITNFLALGSILITFGVVSVFANGSSVVPLKVTYYGTPGEIVHGQVNVFNKANKNTTVTLHADDFLQKWITVPQNSFTIKPGEKTIIPYNMVIPQDASFQKYYGSIHIENSNNNLDETAHLITLEVGKTSTASLLHGSANNQSTIFQIILAVLAVFIFAIALLAIGRYCIMSAKH